MPAYTITINILQSLFPPWRYTLVERTAKWGVDWAADSGDGLLTMKMNESGSSALLRFLVPGTRDQFIVAIGVHNYKRWCDIIPDVEEYETAMGTHMLYYNSDKPHYQKLWAQQSKAEATNKAGNKISINFDVADGENLKATLTIK